MAAGPEVGLLVPGSLPWTEVVGWAGRAEEAGAARVWVGPARGASIVLAGAVGRRTSLRVGVVVPVGEVAATVMAKHLNSLDVVIGGRLDVALLGTPDEVTQTAGVMRAMASGQAVSGGARALPAAVQQPGYPLWEAAAEPPKTDTAPGLPRGWLEAGLALVAVTPW